MDCARPACLGHHPCRPGFTLAKIALWWRPSREHGPQPFTSDGDGNLTSWDGGWNLTYNAQNQTTSIQTGGLSESYTYSGPDQQELLSFTDNGDTTQVANSALGETYQADANGGLRFERDNRGGLVSKTPDGTNYYFYLFDGLGSVVAVTDPSGNVANSYQYDPYGNVVDSSTTVSNPFKYASGWTSNVTTFTHFGARWYAPDPNYGRWTQQDPTAGTLFQPTSRCRYAYASDDPVNLTDAYGRCSGPEISFSRQQLEAIGWLTVAEGSLVSIAGLAASGTIIGLPAGVVLGALGIADIFVGSFLVWYVDQYYPNGAIICL